MHRSRKGGGQGGRYPLQIQISLNYQNKPRTHWQTQITVPPPFEIFFRSVHGNIF